MARPTAGVRQGRCHRPRFDTEEGALQNLLVSLREHLGMEVAFIGQLHDDQRTFRWVDQAPGVHLLEAGTGGPARDSYCHHVVRGRVPGLLADASQHPVTAAMEVTHHLPVGSHISVPIRFSDGRVYGTFCCFSRQVHLDVDERDLAAVEAVAAVAADYLEVIDDTERDRRGRRQRILRAIQRPDAINVVFQPLRDLRDCHVVAVEALARFPGWPEGPQSFFEEAGRHGLTQELEMAAARLALARLADIPPSAQLNVNVSAETLASPAFLDLVADVPPHRLVLEVTEHSAIDDYTELNQVVEGLEPLGIRLSIDDVGMGWSGLSRILECRPSQLKLDLSMVRGVDRDPVRRALIESFCSFTRQIRLDLVAEGIETAEELATLQDLGVPVGQGFHLGRPGPLEDLFPGRS